MADDLESRVKALEDKAVADVRGFWSKADSFFWSVVQHGKNIAIGALAAVSAWGIWTHLK